MKQMTQVVLLAMVMAAAAPNVQGLSADGTSRAGEPTLDTWLWSLIRCTADHRATTR
jgi:hypothetical protein